MYQIVFLKLNDLKINVLSNLFFLDTPSSYGYGSMLLKG